MRNYNGCAILRNTIERCLDDSLTGDIEGAGSLIEDENLRLSNNSSRDCNSLTLTTAEM